jgi:hypothetical protein
MLGETNEKILSIIAHELYKLFRGLLALSSRLAGQRLSVETKDSHIQRLLQFSNNGYNLLENLLEWSRSQMGKKCNFKNE